MTRPRTPISTREQKIDWLLAHVDIWYDKKLGTQAWGRLVSCMKRDGLIARRTYKLDVKLTKERAEAASRHRIAKRHQDIEQGGFNLKEMFSGTVRPDYAQVELGTLRKKVGRVNRNTYLRRFLKRTQNLPDSAIAVLTPGRVELLVTF